VTDAARDPAATAHGHRAVRIGVTGPIGCGKSQVARWLADLGAAVIDADEVAKAVTAPGEPAHDAVIRHFGPAVRTADGMLDRVALAGVVFADPDRLRELEAIVHPAVRPRILAALYGADAAGAPAVVIEAIKLVEGGLASLCDEVWLVTCDAGSQRERILARGTPADDADRRIAAQAGLAERLAPAATHVLDTSGDAAVTRETVETLFRAALSSSA
jgi:dephospho-CoA kinase